MAIPLCRCWIPISITLVRRDFCPALNIDADEADVIASILNQNFVPIVDGRNTLCGILTRRGVIAYLAEQT